MADVFAAIPEGLFEEASAQCLSQQREEASVLIPATPLSAEISEDLVLSGGTAHDGLELRTDCPQDVFCDVASMPS